MWAVYNLMPPEEVISGYTTVYPHCELGEKADIIKSFHNQIYSEEEENPPYPPYEIEQGDKLATEVGDESVTQHQSVFEELPEKDSEPLRQLNVRIAKPVRDAIFHLAIHEDRSVRDLAEEALQAYLVAHVTEDQ